MMPSSPGSLGVPKDVRTGRQQEAEESGVLSPEYENMRSRWKRLSLPSVHPALTGNSEVHFLELWISLEGPALCCGDKLIH